MFFIAKNDARYTVGTQQTLAERVNEQTDFSVGFSRSVGLLNDEDSYNILWCGVWQDLFIKQTGFLFLLELFFHIVVSLRPTLALPGLPGRDVGKLPAEAPGSRGSP